MVNQHNFTGAGPGEQLARRLIVLLAGNVNDDEVGQQVLQIQPQVGLGGGFALPLLDPI